LMLFLGPGTWKWVSSLVSRNLSIRLDENNLSVPWVSRYGTKHPPGYQCSSSGSWSWFSKSPYPVLIHNHGYWKKNSNTCSWSTIMALLFF
jgi:hypothetical protein